MSEDLISRKAALQAILDYRLSSGPISTAVYEKIKELPGVAGQQPAETVPRDGTVFITYFGDKPVFAAWCDAVPEKTYRAGFWTKPTVVPGDPAGFRVVIYSARMGCWGIDGGFAPFDPPCWWSIPQRSSEIRTQTSDKRDG